jgi:hypothetical protein
MQGERGHRTTRVQKKNHPAVGLSRGLFWSVYTHHLHTQPHTKPSRARPKIGISNYSSMFCPYVTGCTKKCIHVNPAQGLLHQQQLNGERGLGSPHTLARCSPAAL